MGTHANHIQAPRREERPRWNLPSNDLLFQVSFEEAAEIYDVPVVL
jgi:hypothetical protein